MHIKISEAAKNYLLTCPPGYPARFATTTKSAISLILQRYRDECHLSYEGIASSVCNMPNILGIPDALRDAIEERCNLYIDELNSADSTRRKHADRPLVIGKTVERFIKTQSAERGSIAAIRDYLVLLDRLPPHALDPSTARLAPAFALRDSTVHFDTVSDQMSLTAGESYGAYETYPTGQDYREARIFQIEKRIYTLTERSYTLRQPVPVPASPPKRKELRIRTTSIYWIISIGNSLYGQSISSQDESHERIDIYTAMGRFKATKLSDALVTVKTIPSFDEFIPAVAALSAAGGTQRIEILFNQKNLSVVLYNNTRAGKVDNNKYFTYHVDDIDDEYRFHDSNLIDKGQSIMNSDSKLVRGVMHWNVNMIVEALEDGANVNLVVNQKGERVIHIAARTGAREVVQECMKHESVDLLARRTDGQLPLDCAYELEETLAAAGQKERSVRAMVRYLQRFTIAQAEARGIRAEFAHRHAGALDHIIPAWSPPGGNDSPEPGR